MRWLLATSIIILLPLLVQAQSYTVRSGEHDGFSRLVLPIPAGIEWSVNSGKQTASVTVHLPNVSFDTSQIFERIPRARVTSAIQESPGAPLVLSLGCDCKINSFRASKSLVAIDISGSPNAQAVPDKNLTKLSSLPVEPKLGRSKEEALLMSIAPDPHLLNASQKQLVLQLQRARKQGIVQASPDPRVKSVEHGEKANMEDTPATVSSAPIQLSAQTVFDEGMASIAEAIESESYQNNCLPDHSVDLANWATEAPFDKQVSALRASLYQEFDKLNPEVAINLARLYLHFGFGIEAERMMRMVTPQTEQHAVLLLMARVIDGDPPQQGLSINDQQTCDGAIAMWAALASNSLNSDANLSAVQRTHSTLPRHLRRHLGPRLAELLADAGQLDASNQILHNSARAGGRDLPPQKLAEAALAETRGNLAVAQKKRDDVASTKSAATPRALMELVETHKSSGDPLPKNVPPLLEAYLLEHRDSKIEPAFHEARVLAHALSGHFSVAIEILRDKSTPLPERTVAAFVPFLTEGADQITFLDFVLEAPESLLNHLDEAASIGIATRLVDLGFATEAMTFLKTDPPAETSDKGRLLRARAALMSGKPHRTLVELLGLDGEQADRLRMSAMWLNQDYEAAARYAQLIDDTERATESLFLAGDFQKASATPEVPMAETARLAETLVVAGQINDESTPLSNARWLLQSSSDTRLRIEDLLSATASPLATASPGS